MSVLEMWANNRLVTNIRLCKSETFVSFYTFALAFAICN